MKEWYKILNRDDGAAEILIYEEIGENYWGEGLSAKQFVKDLQALDVGDIFVHINSPGGNVFDGNSIYNSLRAHKARVHVVIDGIAASIASVIAMAGDTVEMPENAMLMIHDPSGMVWGNAEDMRKMADTLEKLKTGIVASYKTRSNLDEQKIMDMMTETTWMTANEAVEYGFADRVSGKVNIQASFEMLNRFRNVPATLTAGNSGKFKEEDQVMDLKELKAKHPDIYQEVYNLGAASVNVDAVKTDGFKAGAEAERTRIQGVSNQLIPGHERLVNELMWDGQTTPEQAAVQILNAEREIRKSVLVDHALDAPPPVAPAASQDGVDPLKGLPVEARCKAQWERDPKIQAEYDGDFDMYLAYEKAVAEGKVRLLKK